MRYIVLTTVVILAALFLAPLLRSTGQRLGQGYSKIWDAAETERTRPDATTSEPESTPSDTQH